MIAVVTMVLPLLTGSINWYFQQRTEEIAALHTDIAETQVRWTAYNDLVRNEQRKTTVPLSALFERLQSAWDYRLAAEKSLRAGDLGRARLLVNDAIADLDAVPVPLLHRMANMDVVHADVRAYILEQEALGFDMNNSRASLAVSERALKDARLALANGETPTAEKKVREAEAAFRVFPNESNPRPLYQVELLAAPSSTPILVAAAAVGLGLALLGLGLWSRRARTN